MKNLILTINRAPAAKKTKLLTLFLALVSSVGTIFAEKYYNIPIGDLYYDLDATNKTAMVTRLKANYSNLTIASIPNTVEYGAVTYSVTSIGESAFSGCTSLTSVTIPSRITSIGKYAFKLVPNIVYYGSASGSPWGARSVNGYVDGWCVYSNRTKTSLLACPSAATGEIVIPNSVTSIGSSAFYGCSGLTSVTIGNSVTSIGEDAFRGCSGLTSVTIGNSVTSIGRYAFYDCSSLTSVTIPNSVTSIGSSAFNSCSGLIKVEINSSSIIGKAFTSTSNVKNIFGSQVKEYIIGNSVTSIGSNAFYDCSGLTSVTIPNSVTSIGSSAFRGCISLTSVTIPNSVTDIKYETFFGCESLTSVTIPNSVTSIGGDAFCGCSGLTSVTIPNSVTSIGGDAFRGCSGLTSVTIPNSVTSIGSYAFLGCSGLTSVTIPNRVTSIGDYAFSRCSGLTSIVVENGNWVYDSRDNCNAIIRTSTNTLISGCKNTIIPNSVTSIGEGAFVECTGTSVTIPNSVTRIDDYAFYDCIDLTSVTIPNSVKGIGNNAFCYCVHLTSATIGNSVQTIGESAFRGCWDLKSIEVLCETPPSLSSTKTFEDCFSLVSIYVPCGTLEAYKKAWSAYASIINHSWGYTIEGKVNLSEAGTVKMPTPCEESIVTAVPNFGYHFIQWSDGNTDNPRSFVLTQDTTFTAIFAINQYTITFFNEDGTILSSTLWDYGTIPTCDEPAKAEDEQYTYSFAGWNPSIVAVSADAEYRATYTAIPKHMTSIIPVVDKELFSTKIIRNGQLYIQRGEELFNAQGARVK